MCSVPIRNFLAESYQFSDLSTLSITMRDTFSFVGIIKKAIHVQYIESILQSTSVIAVIFHY